MYVDGRTWAIVGGLLLALIALAAYATCNTTGLCQQKTFEFRSMTSVYLIDPSTNDTAWEETKTSISDDLRDPFGDIQIGKLVYSNTPNTTSASPVIYRLGNDIEIVAVTVDSEVLSRVQILDGEAAADVAKSALSAVNESRGQVIFDGVFANSTGLWGYIADEYLSSVPSSVLQSEVCEEFASIEAGKHEAIENAFRYVESDSTIGKLCGIVEGITEGLVEADLLYEFLAPQQCDDANPRKCSDLPGAIRQAYEVMESKEEDEAEANSRGFENSTYEYGVCLYFASDMVTFSSAEGVLDVHSGIKGTWATTSDAAQAGKAAAKELFADGLPGLSLGISVATPDIGKSTDKVDVSTGEKLMIESYWDSFFGELDAEQTSTC